MRKAAVAAQLASCEQRLQEAHASLQAARDRVEALEATLEAIPQPVLVREVDGGVVASNGAARELVTTTPSGAIIRQALDDALHAAVAGGPSSRTLDLNGPPPRSLIVRAVLVEEADPKSAVVIVVDDVTDRRQLDSVRRDFVANVSHELRTPVGALTVLADAMDGEHDAGSLRRLAARVGVEAARAERLIDELLDLSRIEGATQPEVGSVDLASVARDAIERLESLAASRGVAVSTHIHGDGLAPISVPGDERQLLVAITNLIDNAVKYSEANTAVEVNVRDDGAWAQVEVIDKGVGIPTRDLDRIFERFFRVDRARSRDTGGAGLGLSIVRHVAANHDGEVSVSSREGEGSTFSLKLPRVT